jgi:tyrosyl-tRNA synthetase
LFGNGENIKELNEEDLLLSLEGVPVHGVPAAQFADGVDIVTLLSETGVFPSKGEARKMIQGGGVSVNKEKLTEPNAMINSSFLMHGKYILIQKGKKNFYLIKAS